MFEIIGRIVVYGAVAVGAVLAAGTLYLYASLACYFHC